MGLIRSLALNCLPNIGLSPYCPVPQSLFIPVFPPKGFKVKASVDELLDEVGRDGGGEEAELSEVAS